MTNAIRKPDAPVMFRTGDQAWIWCAQLLAARRDGRHPREGEGGNRPCTPDDILVLLNRLHIAGRLTLEQAAVLRRYGDMGRQPAVNMIGEEADWHAWRAAMRALAPVLVSRGIVLPPRAAWERRR